MAARYYGGMNEAAAAAAAIREDNHEANSSTALEAHRAGTSLGGAEEGARQELKRNPVSADRWHRVFWDSGARGRVAAVVQAECGTLLVANEDAVVVDDEMDWQCCCKDDVQICPPKDEHHDKRFSRTDNQLMCIAITRYRL